MNVAAVSQVSSSSPTINNAGSIAIPVALASAGELGAFSSLLDGLVNKREESFLAGLIEEPPLGLTSSNTAPVSAKGKGTKSETNSSTGKKDESKPNLVSVQATGEPQLPIIKPPILFRAATWETYSQDPKTSPNEPRGDGAANGQPDAAVISTLSPRAPTTVPDGNEPTSTARIAFGLHLTTSDQEPDTPAGGAMEFKLNNPTLENESTNLRSPISAARVTVDANHIDATQGAPSNSRTVPNVPNDANSAVLNLSLPSKRPPSPTNVSERVRAIGSADSREDDTEIANPEPATRSWPGASTIVLASGHGMAEPATALSADPAEQPDVQESDSDAKLATAPSSSAIPVSNLSGPLTDPRAAGLQPADAQKPPEEAWKQNAVLGNGSSSTPAGQSVATPAYATSADWLASLQPQKEQKPADEHDNGGPVLNMFHSQTDASRDLPESSGAESRGNASTVEGLPVQATGEPNTRMGRSGTAPPQATSARSTAAGATSSPFITSPAAASQGTPLATPSQAPPSQATPLQGTLVPAVLNPVTLSQPVSPQATPAQTMASQTAMSAEINTAAKPPAATQISLQLTGEDSTKVNVDLSERAGKVQVAVRTADPDLTKSMRTDLGDLVERLENKGFKTEAWVPAISRHMPAAAPEQSGSANSQSNPRHSGSGMGQRQGRQGQSGSNQRQQARWTAQLEETLSTEETRTNSE